MLEQDEPQDGCGEGSCENAHDPKENDRGEVYRLGEILHGVIDSKLKELKLRYPIYIVVKNKQVLFKVTQPPDELPMNDKMKPDDFDEMMKKKKKEPKEPVIMLLEITPEYVASFVSGRKLNEEKIYEDMIDRISKALVAIISNPTKTGITSLGELTIPRSNE